VFHELTKIGAGRFQQKVGKFFNNRYLKKIWLKDGVRKVSFHSFRHSLETHFTNQNINPRFIDYLQGHSSKDTSANIYMKGINQKLYWKNVLRSLIGVLIGKNSKWSFDNKNIELYYPQTPSVLF
jgi:integrase